MRALAIVAFVLDGAAAIGFIALMALGDGRITPLDGFVLTALLLGFCTALGSVMLLDRTSAEDAAAFMLQGAAMFDRLPDASKRDLREHFPMESPGAGLSGVAQHLAILSQPSIDAGTPAARVQ